MAQCSSKNDDGTPKTGSDGQPWFSSTSGNNSTLDPATVKLELIEGGKLSTSLGRSPLFPPLMTHMLAVGEQSGTLEGMLEKAGAAYEREFATAVARATALLEPLLVLGMGVAVGFVVVAVLLPIFQLNQLVK